MKNTFVSVIFCLLISINYAQTKIPLIKKGGVYEVACKVNGKDANFIFDSGASDVQLSMEFLSEGIKNGTFRKSDIFLDVKEFKVASGEIVKGRNVNIRQLKIGDLELFNVIGSIIESPNTPMLLGQSAIEKFGTYTVDYNKMLLTIEGNSASKIEKDLIAQSKQPGMEKIIGAKLKSLAILPYLEFEVADIKQTGEGATSSLDFRIDITNNSNFNYVWTDGGLLQYTVEVTTEDGKRYTSSVVGIVVNLLSGQTGNSFASLSIRGKKPVQLRIYSSLQ